MTTNRSELFAGLDLLLEAAEYHSTNKITPPRHQTKSILFTKPVSFDLPPMKRIKLDFGDVNDGARLRPNPSSPLKVIELKSIKKPNKCQAGSAHRMWERTDEYAMAASSVRLCNSLHTIKAMKQQDVPVTKKDKKSFVRGRKQYWVSSAIREDYATERERERHCLHVRAGMNQSNSTS